MNLILGIDPGLSGALALYDPKTGHLRLHHMPNQKAARNGKSRGEVDGYTLGMLIDSFRPDIARAYIEQVSGRPGQAGQFQFGLNTGVVHGILYANLIPIEFVASSKWKAAMGLRRAVNETKADAKSAARRLAMQKFPQHAAAFQRVKDDGVAEASLIALYGAHLMKG